MVSVSIEDSSQLGAGNGGITVSSLDSATIDASANGGALALGTASVGIGIGLAIGASVAINTISDQVLANVVNSTVTSAGDLSITATTQNSTDSLVIALAFSLGVAGAASLPIPIGIAVSGAARRRPITSKTRLTPMWQMGPP